MRREAKALKTQRRVEKRRREEGKEKQREAAVRCVLCSLSRLSRFHSYIFGQSGGQCVIHRLNWIIIIIIIIKRKKLKQVFLCRLVKTHVLNCGRKRRQSRFDVVD